MTAVAMTSNPDLYTSYFSAIRDGDRRRAFEIIDSARTSGISLASLYLEVFQPALREIGCLWQDNKISVADEHLATAITQAAMAHAYQSAFAWSTTQGRSLIAACVDSERHEVGLRMLCDLLDLEGWQTTYLGAMVPIESLVAMVKRRRPDAVALSAALSPHLPRVREMINAIHEAMGDTRPLIIVGGRLFLDNPTLATHLGADFTATDAVEAVRLLGEHVNPVR